MAKSDRLGHLPPLARQLADQLETAIRDAELAPPAGARDLQVLTGVTTMGTFTRPLETVIRDFVALLMDRSRHNNVYIYGDDLVVESHPDESKYPRLIVLRSDHVVTPEAAGCLANLMICRVKVKDNTIEFSTPSKALGVLLNAEPVEKALPRIQMYARRPVFTGDFHLQGPGYDPTSGILVHGPAITPILTAPVAAEQPIDRLPPRLRELLGGFCFRESCDLVNTVGLMVTGLLANHFIENPKAIAVIDGNQPGIGKTLLMSLVGMILDGVVPQLLKYTPHDDELQKQICATLRPGRQSVLLFDNAKHFCGSAISSPVIEANSMAPEISMRILGYSQNFVRPNDVLWALTMNQTRLSPDLVSRSLPIRLAYLGEAGKRRFDGPDPLQFARERRLEILGELAGMVIRWNQLGRPMGPHTHRCHRWAQLIGGILTANGFPEFLANYDTAANEFDANREELATVAELVLADPKGPFIVIAPEVTP